MNIIKAGYEVMPKFENPLKKVELVARTCYKSEDHITDDSCYTMVKNLVNRQHYAMLEHASLAYIVDYQTFEFMYNFIHNSQVDIYEEDDRNVYPFKNYIKFTVHNIEYKDDVVGDRFIISGNLRAFLEAFQALLEHVAFLPPNLVHAVAEDSYGAVDFRASLLDEDANASRESIKLIDDFSELTLEERFVHETITVKFTVDRGVTHELVRHRDCSFAQESTRYCNYSKGKFGNEVSFILPCFWDCSDNDSDALKREKFNDWRAECESSEQRYFKLLSLGATPQEARTVLNNSTKAEIFMTADIREWIHILELRALGTTGKPHPQMEEVMIPLARELANGLLSDFTSIDSVKRMLTLNG